MMGNWSELADVITELLLNSNYKKIMNTMKEVTTMMEMFLTMIKI